MNIFLEGKTTWLFQRVSSQQRKLKIQHETEFELDEEIPEGKTQKRGQGLASIKMHSRANSSLMKLHKRHIDLFFKHL